MAGMGFLLNFSDFMHNLFDFALSVKEFDTFKKIAGEKSDFANLTVFKGGHEFVPYDEPIIQLTNALKGF